MATHPAHHASLLHAPSDLIAGRWRPLPGDTLTSRNPARPDHVVYAATPVRAHVDEAVAAARRALPEWSAWPRDRRFAALRRYADLAKQHAARVAELLCDEVGKALHECKGEAALLAGKVDITLDEQAGGTTLQSQPHNKGLARVAPFSFNLTPQRTAACWFRPHGVMAVLGPFNFPVHLPNGHIIPALAMGNTVVFKPSDKAPACGQLLTELLHQALEEHGAPAGTINLVQGGVDNAQALVRHDGLDGILFTGSWPVGRAILEANLDRPGRIIALELGGNNPCVVMPDADLKRAAIEITKAAFATTGQRCTCTRRVIVHEAVAGKLLPAIVQAARALAVTDPRSEPCFMGPLVTRQSRDAALTFQEHLRAAGANLLLPMSTDIPAAAQGGHFITPGIARVERFVPQGFPPGWGGSPSRHSAPGGTGLQPVPSSAADSFHPGLDEELFAPLLRVCTVRSLDEAIEQANATRYGLAASLFTADAKAADRFRAEARAGCVNINCGTAGASGQLPFGGLGLSGNHRPAGSFSLDYCAYPVAGMTEDGEAALVQGMTFDANWLA